MKRAVIGGFLTLIGTIWCMGGLVGSAANMYNVSSWFTPPGRFGTAMLESGMVWPVVLGGLLLVAGLVVLGVEYFRKGE